MSDYKGVKGENAMVNERWAVVIQGEDRHFAKIGYDGNVTLSEGAEVASLAKQFWTAMFNTPELARALAKNPSFMLADGEHGRVIRVDPGSVTYFKQPVNQVSHEFWHELARELARIRHATHVNS
jgi:hypothetical protein